jgi:hypothetical protein
VQVSGQSLMHFLRFNDTAWRLRPFSLLNSCCREKCRSAIHNAADSDDGGCSDLILLKGIFLEQNYAYVNTTCVFLTSHLSKWRQ